MNFAQSLKKGRYGWKIQVGYHLAPDVEEEPRRELGVHLKRNLTANHEFHLKPL